VTLGPSLSGSHPLTNPFGTLSPANIAGSLKPDAQGQKLGSFGKITVNGWHWYPKTTPTTPTPHQGIDYGCPIGTNVLAVEAGQIMAHGWDPARGHFVLVRWPTKTGGWAVSCQQHLKAFARDVGAKVAKGEHVAASGCSGQCTEPHEHLEVHYTTVHTASWLGWQGWLTINPVRCMAGGDLEHASAIEHA
jgi:murein DD-endopeptidase MepM/ murein hydrolase activator NlpD